MSKKFLIKNHPNFCLLVAKMSDVILYFLAGFFSYYFKFGNFHLPQKYLIAILFGTLLLSPIFSYFQVYESLRGRKLSNYFRPLYFASLFLITSLAAIAFITKTGEQFSRLWFLWWQVWAMIFFLGLRVLLRQSLFALRRKGFNHKFVIIIGSSGLIGELAERANKEIWFGFSIKKVYTNLTAAELNNLNIFSVIAANAIDEVWLMPTFDERELVKSVLQQLKNSLLTIRYFPEICELNPVNQNISEILGVPVINIISSPMMGVNRILKALEDRILSVIFFLLVSPLMLLLALMVRLTSPGPILYRQWRHGWDGRPILIYKFRTMFVHHEEHGVITQAVSTDPRITKIGKILRRTSLDELPQLFNVLRGEMSIVGPRPHAIVHNEYYKDLVTSFMQRHQVKPGITGWAQVNGWRGKTDTLDKMQKRVEYDLFYINNWSLWFDIKIIFLTIFSGFINKNAY